MIARVLLLASAPILALASAWNNAQQPIQDSPTEVNVLKLTHDLHYTFQPIKNVDPLVSATPLYATQDLVFYGESKHTSGVVRIPANATDPGYVVFSALSIHAHAASAAVAAGVRWYPIDGKRAGGIALQGMGVRREGMVSMAVESARLDLGTPFVVLPGQMWEVLALATRPHTEGLHLRVDCERRGVFPDLVFDDGEGEIVVTPWQYVLEVVQGRCLLLAREMGEKGQGVDTVLGWAAVRGRVIIVDVVEKRMGISR